MRDALTGRPDVRLIVGAVGISAPGFMSLQVPAERIGGVDELVAAIEAAAAEGVQQLETALTLA